MSRQCRIILLLLIAGLLSACGPIYKTEYAYSPPKSSMGNMCISQCINNKGMCEQMCQMRNENCRTRSRQDALYQYEVYKSKQLAKGERVDRDPSYFENSFGCNTSCDCNPTYNACYSSCGGQVLERKVCVAFCGN